MVFLDEPTAALGVRQTDTCLISSDAFALKASRSCSSATTWSRCWRSAIGLSFCVSVERSPTVQVDGPDRRDGGRLYHRRREERALSAALQSSEELPLFLCIGDLDVDV